MKNNKISKMKLKSYENYFLVKKKNRNIIGCLFIGLFSVLCILFFTDKTLGEQDSLENTLKDMATDFYENFYYDQVKQISKEEDYLSKFELIGIKISLVNLKEYDNGKYISKVDRFVNSKTKVSCNKYNTVALIYPKAPYGKVDYEIEVNLECEAGSGIN